MKIKAMTSQQLKQALDHSCVKNDSCRIAAGLSKGAARRKYMRYAKRHSDNIKALSDALYGPINDNITIEELFKALAD